MNQAAIAPEMPNIGALSTLAANLLARLEQAVVTDSKALEIAVVSLLSGGHLLIEDVPGVGKTTLARALAKATGSAIRRVQMTPDLLPADLTGVNVLNTVDNSVTFRPGPIFANIVIADEINRASARTQSALLEAMQEQQVTIDGKTYRLPEPFMVIATANPIELVGTFALPEAQRDRFTARVTLGYPSKAHELDVLNDNEPRSAYQQETALSPVTSPQGITLAVNQITDVYCASSIKEYIIDLTRASREHPALALGASPRAGIQLLRATKALAVLRQRDHVLPDDVQELAGPVLSHRLMLSGKAKAGGVTADEVVAQLLTDTPLPHRASNLA